MGRKSLWIIVIGALVATLLGGFGAGTAAAEPDCAPFPDVTADNQHCRSIAWLADTGITKPADGHYRPDAAVNRGSMTAFLYRLANPGAAAPACTVRPFPDVPAESTFCGSITWAKQVGLVRGSSDGTYRPAATVTRGAMAAMLYRLAHPGVPAPECYFGPFDDVPVGSTFCGVVTWLVEAGVTRGIGDGSRYGVRAPVTRASMATFLKRIEALLADDGAMPAEPAPPTPPPPAPDPPFDPGGSHAYLAEIADAVDFATKLQIAVTYLPDGGQHLGDVFYGPASDETLAGTVQMDNCEMWINWTLPNRLILDIVRHEYFHVLQCRTWGLGTASAYGGAVWAERAADIATLLLGGSYTYYLDYDPVGYGPAQDWEVRSVIALLAQYGIEPVGVVFDTSQAVRAAPAVSSAGAWRGVMSDGADSTGPLSGAGPIAAGMLPSPRG